VAKQVDPSDLFTFYLVDILAHGQYDPLILLQQTSFVASLIQLEYDPSATLTTQAWNYWS